MSSSILDWPYDRPDLPYAILVPRDASLAKRDRQSGDDNGSLLSPDYSSRLVLLRRPPPTLEVGQVAPGTRKCLCMLYRSQGRWANHGENNTKSRGNQGSILFCKKQFSFFLNFSCSLFESWKRSIDVLTALKDGLAIIHQQKAGSVFTDLTVLVHIKSPSSRTLGSFLVWQNLP